jgi:hypothetical protein
MHFIGQAVVQIVLHLVDQIVVVQVAQDDFVVSHGIAPRCELCCQSQKDAASACTGSRYSRIDIF